ncbi:hypothetical protein KS4_14700 [Poriferisphaera corsica]|uniref:Uncharacterized protein n=1 Tax=Poriferisphaera corsica TaxID=2528020 RepID=A0A517YT87_9BACT|nr:hypothetical protein KS4_14700 [Poriferisphaera corsica]
MPFAARSFTQQHKQYMITFTLKQGVINVMAPHLTAARYK